MEFRINEEKLRVAMRKSIARNDNGLMALCLVDLCDGSKEILNNLVPNVKNYSGAVVLFDTSKKNRVLLGARDDLMWDDPELLVAVAGVQIASLYRDGLISYFDGDSRYESVDRKKEAFEILLASNKMVANGAVLADIGHSYEMGYGANQSYDMAKKYYLEAIELGNTTAMMNLGAMYMYGNGVRCIENRALCLFIQAALLGNSDGFENVVSYYIEKDNYYLADSYARVGVLKDVDYCIYILAYFYENGIVEKQNYKKAVELYSKMKSNYETRDASIGRIYFEQEELGKSKEEALALLDSAARNGSDYAAMYLTNLYGKDGEFKDLDKSLEYYEMHIKYAREENEEC